MQLVDHLSKNQVIQNSDSILMANTSNNGIINQTKHSEDIAKESDQTKVDTNHVLISISDLMNFRTHQCQDYQHGVCKDSMKCWDSHSETWPRRSPLTHNYDYKLCSNINFVKSLDKMQLQGKCKYGRKCRYSHSKEEQLYHPLLYKTRLCLNYPKCKSYYCPFAHGTAELRNTKQLNGLTNGHLMKMLEQDADNALPVSPKKCTPSTASPITSSPNTPIPLSSPVISHSPNLSNITKTNTSLDLLDKRLDMAFESLDAAHKSLGSEKYIDLNFNSDLTFSQWLDPTTAAPDTDHFLDTEEPNFYETIKAGREMYTTWGPYSGLKYGHERSSNHSLDELMDDQWISEVVQTGLDMVTEEANRFLTTRVVNLSDHPNFDLFDFDNQTKNSLTRFELLSNTFPQHPTTAQEKDCINKEKTKQGYFDIQ